MAVFNHLVYTGWIDPKIVCVCVCVCVCTHAHQVHLVIEDTLLHAHVHATTGPCNKFMCMQLCMCLNDCTMHVHVSFQNLLSLSYKSLYDTAVSFVLSE